MYLWGPHIDATKIAYQKCISVLIRSVFFKTPLRKLNEIQFRFNTHDNIWCLHEWLLIMTMAQQEHSLLSHIILEMQSSDEVSEQFGNSPELIIWPDNWLFLQLWYQYYTEFGESHQSVWSDKFCDDWGSYRKGCYWPCQWFPVFLLFHANLLER